MKQVTQEELFSKMDPSVHDAIRAKAREFKATHVILFECQQMDSSHFGERSVAMCGPNNTFQTPQMAERSWLKDLPSQRQYPVEYCDVKL